MCSTFSCREIKERGSHLIFSVVSSPFPEIDAAPRMETTTTASTIVEMANKVRPADIATAMAVPCCDQIRLPTSHPDQ